MTEQGLTRRWTTLRRHEEQIAYRRSLHRFNVCPAGRRSGKTELAKRKVVERAILGTEFTPARYFLAAPTRDQGKRIFWDDIKAMVPRNLTHRVVETDLMIALPLSEIWVIGMDKPERMEGTPWDGGCLDEYGNMKARAWGENVRPSLSDRLGWCDFIGGPEGRNHYYDLYQYARAQMMEHGEASEWGAYHWVSADILPAEEIEAAKRDLDELTFQQEYEASFVNFVGRAYYPFTEATHTRRLEYNPRAPLILCFDFNVSPGVAAVCQEKEEGTGVIGEVWIPQNSNTPAVCRKLAADWGKHGGQVLCYGDATGGAGGSAKVAGSDWDLIKRTLGPVFGSRMSFHVPSENPRERTRVNAVNSRLRASDGTIRLFVDPSKAPHVVRDFEGVRLLEGGSGEIDKSPKRDKTLTHLTDALGYYIEREFPIRSRTIEQVRLKVR